MKIRKHVLLNIIVPILAGTLIYLFLAPDTFIVKGGWRILGRRNPLEAINIMDFPYPVRWIRFYVCDALWTYALSNTVILILGDAKRNILIGCSIGILFSIIMELLQLFSFFPGTFDIWDIFTAIIAGITAGIINKEQKENFNYEKNKID